MASKRVFCLGLALALALATVSADDEPLKVVSAPVPPVACNSGSQSHESLHDQIVSLSNLIDPSGKLTKLIADFHPHPAHSANATTPSTTTTPAPDQVKRSAEEEKKPTEAETASTTTSTSTQAPVAGSSAAPEMMPTPVPSSPSSSTNAPKPADNSNVTVNIVLQLVSDAKTEEIINNPDKVLSSTTAAPEVNSTTASTSASSTSLAAAVAASSSEMPSSTVAPASSTLAPATTAAPAPVEPPVLVMNSTGSGAVQARRKRAAVLATASSAPTTSKAPATTSTSAPSPAPAATSTTSTTTTSTTTTTTTTPAPTTTSTTTTTTTTTPAPSSTSTPATVEISVKDLTPEKREQITAAATTTIEVVSSSVGPTTRIIETSTTTTTTPTTTTTTTTTPAPSTSTSTMATSTSTAAAPESPPTSAAPSGPMPKLGKPADAIRTSRVFNSEGTLAAATGTIDNNLNVIYDNDTALDMELPLKKSSSSPFPPTMETIGGTTTDSKATSSPISDFVNCDRNEEGEKEIFGSCLLESVRRSSNNNRNQSELLLGRLNFWQPINNAGVLHMLVRVRYEPIEHQQVANNRTRRESFTAPVERVPPILSNATKMLVGEFPRHKVWLLGDSCDIGGPRQLIAEVSQSQMVQSSQLVELDAELIVPRFNLTGHNEIANKHLLVSLPNGNPLACCRLNLTESPAPFELDNLPSVSVVQPTRESLLPDSLKSSNKPEERVKL